MGEVCPTPYAGSWYPGDRNQLRDLLADLFAQSEQRTGPAARRGAYACLVPHAGLVYSGTVAATAYRHIAAQKPKVVVILGFLHSRRHSGIAIAAPDAYITPLGELPVATLTVDQLVATGAFHCVSAGSASDHSVEIQFPLLQWALPGTYVVPVYVGDLSVAERTRAAEALAGLPADTVVVASSDLTHYGQNFGYTPFPHDEDLDDNLRRLDADTLEAVGTLETEDFLTQLVRTRDTVCGRAPIALLLETMKRKPGAEVFQQLLDYRTSRDVTGDSESSVSYGAAAYFPADAFALDEQEAHSLLDSACRSLSQYSRGGGRVPVRPDDQRTGALSAPGVFVTVRRHQRLCGCLGRVGNCPPLRDCVPSLALSAALDDGRFVPTARAACAELDVEISILTPRKHITSPDKFQPGVHGALLEHGSCTGLLLPQVGRREGWNRDRFLRALSLKAGLHESAWKHRDTQLSVFQAFAYERTHDNLWHSN